MREGDVMVTIGGPLAGLQVILLAGAVILAAILVTGIVRDWRRGG